MRWSHDGFINIMRAERHEVVRPEPFEAIELAVGTLFGDEAARFHPLMASVPR